MFKRKIATALPTCSNRQATKIAKGSEGEAHLIFTKYKAKHYAMTLPPEAATEDNLTKAIKLVTEQHYSFEFIPGTRPSNPIQPKRRMHSAEFHTYDARVVQLRNIFKAVQASANPTAVPAP